MRNFTFALVLGVLALNATAQTAVPAFTSFTGVVYSYPVLSPDGKTIVFTSNRTGTNQIYVMDTDGKNIRQFTFSEKYDNNCPVWSPDGKTIVFASERDEDSEIYIMNADGSGQKRLTNQKGDDSHPHFSPDGRRIIFNSARLNPDLTIDWGKQVHEIFTMNTDGSDVKQVSNFGTLCTYPSISPDGKKISFRRMVDVPGFNFDLSVNRRNSEVFVMNIDGTGAVNISNSPAYDGWPMWTKDNEVVFSSNRNGVARVTQLFRSDDKGLKVEQITHFKNAVLQASITPDGKSVYCQYNCEQEAGLETGGIISLLLPGR